MFEIKLLMIQSHQVQDRCMKIVNMHRVLRNVVAKFICLAIYAGLNTTTCHPYRKAAGMMISSVIILCQFTLAIIGAAKLATPYHQCFIKQATLF